MSLRRSTAAVFAAVLIVFAVSFFTVLPRQVDRLANRTFENDSGNESPPLHAGLRIADLHADSLLWARDLLKEHDRGHVDLPRLQKGNIALQVFSIVTQAAVGLNIDSNPAGSDMVRWLMMAQRWPTPTWDGLGARARYQIRRLHEAVEGSRGRLRLIRTRQDLAGFLEDRRARPDLVAALLAVEGAQMLEGDLGNLRDFEEAGVRMIGVTHLSDNDLAGAQAGESKDGLTPLGLRWVAEMDRRKLIIDLAHASAATIDQILQRSTRAPLVSHTGLKRTCDNNRNLSDEQLRAIAARGGLIGIGFWPEALCGETLGHLARALRGAIDVVGIDHVALGSDWDGFVPVVVAPARLGDLTRTLEQAGFSEDEIRKLMGENTLRFFRLQLP